MNQDEIFVVEHMFGSKMDGDGVIGYASSWEEGKRLAQDHFGKPLTWITAYDSMQSTSGRHFYSVYSELVNSLTRSAGERKPVWKRFLNVED